MGICTLFKVKFLTGVTSLIFSLGEKKFRYVKLREDCVVH